MFDNKSDYCSFLLSMKQVQTDNAQTWVVAMRNVRTGHQLIFYNLDGLIRFLQAEFGDIPGQKEAGQLGTQDMQVYSIV